MDDEKIGAFLDRELNDEEREQFERALAENPGAAMRLRLMRRADDLLRRTLQPESAPGDHVLAQRILAAEQIRRPVSVSIVRQFAAIAAACVIGVLFGTALQRPAAPLLSLSADSAALQATLDTARTGETRIVGASRVTIALTVRTPEGYCRQVRFADNAGETDALACRSNDRWIVAFAAPAPAQATEYNTAAASQAPFEAALIAMGDSVLVYEAEEETLIGDAWRQTPGRAE